MGSQFQRRTTLCLGFLLVMVSGTMGAAPKRPVDVPFGRNYLPTWAFDHIKYYNGGSNIDLVLDKYTGNYYSAPIAVLLYSCSIIGRFLLTLLLFF